MLLGYPLWPQGFLSYKFSDDGIRGVDCLLPHNPNGCHIPGICPDAPNEVLFFPRCFNAEIVIKLIKFKRILFLVNYCMAFMI